MLVAKQENSVLVQSIQEHATEKARMTKNVKFAVDKLKEFKIALDDVRVF